MADKQIEIYRAGSSQEAFFLQNLLAERGIQAQVTNAVLEGGAGVDIVGWPTAPRVVVAAADAPLARAVVLEFDRRKGELIPTPATSGQAPAADVGEPWPACPQCGKPRLTTCPVCHTSGTAFPPGDEMPSDDEEAEEVAEAAPAAERMLICPTCDEPFVPQYLPRCEWCGHVFDAQADEPPWDIHEPRRCYDPINVRMVIAILVIVVFILALILSFVFPFWWTYWSRFGATP